MKNMNWKQLEEDLKEFIEMADRLSSDYFGSRSEDINANAKGPEDFKLIAEQKQATYCELLKVLFPIAVENNTKTNAKNSTEAKTK
jgi:hypothetical protein